MVQFYDLLYVRHVICTNSDHTEVRRGHGLSYMTQPNHTLRVYAVTGNNRLIGAGLSFITLVQFTLGMYMSVLFALQGCASPFARPQTYLLKPHSIPKAAQVPAAPLEEYQICLFQRWRTGELVYTVLSVLYGVFCLSIHRSRGPTNLPSLKISLLSSLSCMRQGNGVSHVLLADRAFSATLFRALPSTSWWSLPASSF